MAEQGNLSPHSMSQQGHGYSHGTQIIRSVDDVAVGGNSPQRISDLDRSGDTLDHLAPIFPPQNFEVPDISFSNSVSPNVDFNQSLLSSANMFGNSNAVYTNVSASSSHVLGGGQSMGQSHQHHNHPGLGGHQMAVSGQQQGAYFPSASRSPLGSSSSDDSDDLPLAQLAKRAATGSTATNAGTSVSAASPSAPSTDTTSMEGSPISGVTPKKAKQTKRKKKKDPNEPQKPVSAYALFFRDTQATIKGHNPSASFGEVSKIVASMWDQLDPEHKDVYKKKTETAKKHYLQQLAAYRASQVSQSAPDDAEKSSSPPGVGMSGTPSFQTMAVGSPPGSNVPVSISGTMMGQQRAQIQQQHSPSHVMQMSPPHMMQQHQMQQQLLLQQQINMSQQAQPSPPHQHSPQQEMTCMSGPAYASPPHVNQTSYQPNIVDHNNVFGYIDPEVNMDVTYSQCIRSGCRNHARENPAWDSEYCSNDCVITHCRDIFKTWVASRSGTNTYPVK